MGKNGFQEKTRDPLFHSNKAYLGQEELGYLQGQRVTDMINEQQGKCEAPGRNLPNRIGIRNA